MSKFPFMLGHQGGGVSAGTWDALIESSNPLAWWKLADVAGSATAADSSGNGHTGTDAGAVFGAWSPLGSAPSETGASFNGTSSITTTYNPSGLTALSVVFIFNANGNSQAAYNRVISNDATTSDNNGFEVTLYGTTNLQVQVAIGNGTTFGEITLTNGTVNAIGTHIVVVTWDGTTIRCYLDGVLDTVTAALTGTLSAGAANIAIGTLAPYNYENYVGELGQVTLFGSALNQTQISALVTAASEAVVSTAHIILGGRSTYGNSGNAENTFIESIGGDPAHSVLMEFLANGTWTNIFDTTGGFGVDFTGWPGAKMIKVPMCQGTAQPAGTFLWTDVTGGSQDANFTAFFQWCVTAGVINICPGWEMNGNWYPWGVYGYDTVANQQGFVAVYQHIVTLARAVSQSFKFWWNPDFLGGNGMTTMAPGGPYYPGDAYVDVIGLDIYNTYNAGTVFPGDAQMLSLLTTGPTPNWNQCLAYCQAHNKALCVPEWGMSAGGVNGGDDPNFVSNVFALAVTAVNLGVKVYLMPWNNVNANPFNSGSYPNSLAELTTLVGQAVAEGLILSGAAPPPTLGITQVSTQNATVGVAFSLTLAPQGGTAPYSLTSTGLPAGISLLGVTISGTPTATFSSTVTITATDSSSPQQTATMSFVFDVAAAGGTNPSGVPMPAANAYSGFTRVLADDFLGTTLSSTWGTGFTQNTAAGGYGPWISTQGSVAGSMATIVNSNVLVGGVETRSGTGLWWNGSTVGGIVEVRAQCSDGEGVSMMLGTMGSAEWPPQIQFYGDAPTGGTRTTTLGSVWYNNPFVEATPLSESGVDATQWNTWGVQWNASTVSFTVNGTTWGTMANPGWTGAYGLGAPQVVYMQLGVNNGAAVGAGTPAVVTMNIDWVVAYESATSVLALNPLGNQTGTVGAAADVVLGATGGIAPYTFSSTTTPPGTTLDGDAIFGEWSLAGTYPMDISVVDSSSPQQTASQTFTIVISAASSGSTPAYPPAGVSLGAIELDTVFSAQTTVGAINFANFPGWGYWGNNTGSMNSVGLHASNVNINSSGQLVLTLASSSSGGAITTTEYGTGGSYVFVHGFIEYDFIVPSGGWWAAWMTCTSADTVDDYFEVDWAEGGAANGVLLATNLWGGTSPGQLNQSYNGWVHSPYSPQPTVGEHVVLGCYWNTGVLKTYVNGALVESYGNNQGGSGIPIASVPSGLILNIGAHGGEATPINFLVNSVKVWPLS